jgi:hypothetical protein
MARGAPLGKVGTNQRGSRINLSWRKEFLREFEETRTQKVETTCGACAGLALGFPCNRATRQHDHRKLAERILPAGVRLLLNFAMNARTLSVVTGCDTGTFADKPPSAITGWYHALLICTLILLQPRDRNSS